MRHLVENLRADSTSFDLEETDEGFILTRRIGRDDEFNQLVRRLINRTDDQFVILPVNDGPKAYGWVILLPL